MYEVKPSNIDNEGWGSSDRLSDNLPIPRAQDLGVAKIRAREK